jgi:uncharacterized protein (TIGR01777 family)
MIIVMTGGTGLIGTALAELLRHNGHVVRLLSRQRAQPERNLYHWNPQMGLVDESVWEGAEALIHLAGESISIPWTTANKKRIVQSRLSGGETLLKSLKHNNIHLKTILTASAIGWYPSDEQLLMTEDLPSGTGFLAETTRAWEEVNAPLAQCADRHCTMRIGLVLSHRGGLLKPLLPLYKAGLGSPLGNGQSWMAWIDHQDLVAAMAFLLEESTPAGIYNLTAPEPVRNRTFSSALAKALGRPHILPAVPAWILKWVLGERHQLVLMSQKALPTKLQHAGFVFQYPTLAQSLQHQLS